MKRKSRLKFKTKDEAASSTVSGSALANVTKKTGEKDF